MIPIVNIKVSYEALAFFSLLIGPEIIGAPTKASGLPWGNT